MRTATAILLIFYFLTIILKPISSQNNTIKLCEVCVCSEIFDTDETHLVLNILCSEMDFAKKVPDLNKIGWPENPNKLKISTTFAGLTLPTLSKLPPNSEVETLKFTNNAIRTYWPDPFSDLPYLLKLSFSFNELSQITPDLFTNIELLEELDLSYNKLEDFNPIDFKSLVRVKRFNLQGNQLKKIPLGALQPMIALEDLDLSKNAIYDMVLKRSDDDALKGIKRLSLNSNRIRSVMKDSFPMNNSIEYLDLSQNLIEIIEEELFLSCINLRELNLAQNNITLNFALPPSLQIAIFKINTMYHWPTFPRGIHYIDVSYNRLKEFMPQNIDYDNLEVLNIGGNQLKELNVSKKLSKLFSLDISYNLLEEIPESLSSANFPNLKELRLDGNPIKTVYFKNIISLKNLYMNELNNLVTVDEKAFSNVMGRSSEEGSDSKSCLALYLSNSRTLTELSVGAFDGTPLCMLDISKNNLSAIPRGAVRWAALSEGADLQRNPWACSCDTQWLLDELLPLLYTRHPHLLTDLRCESPRPLRGVRMVHWYNWTDRDLCADRTGAGQPLYSMSSSTEEPSLIPKMTTQNIILLSCNIVLLIIAIILIIIIITDRRKRRQNQTVKRRQNGVDVNRNREHATLLNKV